MDGHHCALEKWRGQVCRRQVLRAYFGEWDQAGKIIIKGDQENSMSYLMDHIVEMRGEGKTIAEESLVKSKGSSGKAERAVQEIEAGVHGMFFRT